MCIYSSCDRHFTCYIIPEEQMHLFREKKKPSFNLKGKQKRLKTERTHTDQWSTSLNIWLVSLGSSTPGRFYPLPNSRLNTNEMNENIFFFQGGVTSILNHTAWTAASAMKRIGQIISDYNGRLISSRARSCINNLTVMWAAVRNES